jgi:hypothetical protein
VSPWGRVLAVPLLYNKDIVKHEQKKNTDTTTNMEQPPPDSPAALPLFTTGRGDYREFNPFSDRVFGRFTQLGAS